ncbi:Abi family protein [Bifidobacterium sp. 64T4]|uniref:Abi family protein n=1 Tax=Bifidobacterium pongonis TaxID=2834432 RepID=UPI001C585757|nr:Abi family protein [Bifidobacterium pongonis]
MHKPFMSVDDQVALLGSRGMQTDARTAWILEREGYYSVVNGYKVPFLDASAGNAAQDDRYLPGVSFSNLYDLFRFDRNLRFLIFRMTTLAEAVLKTICSYEFTKVNACEVNPYLNIENYATEVSAHKKAEELIPVLEKIISLNKKPNGHVGKAYIKHCIHEHDGEIPLWVLVNDLTLGQMYWFFQAQDNVVRGNIARSFTALYRDSHKQGKEITSIQLDKIYRRIRDFRNICAHDERLYCAHPQSKNITVFQLVKDFAFVIDKKRYIDFLQSLESLLKNLEKSIPDYMGSVYSEMGLQDYNVLRAWIEQTQKM